MLYTSQAIMGSISSSSDSPEIKRVNVTPATVRARNQALSGEPRDYKGAYRHRELFRRLARVLRFPMWRPLSQQDFRLNLAKCLLGDNENWTSRGAIYKVVPYLVLFSRIPVTIRVHAA